ncbi:MAG: hypothetical protein AAGG01_23865, partial [Planctomycetota bacterium]
DFYGTTIPVSSFNVLLEMVGLMGGLGLEVTSVEFDRAPGGPLGLPDCDAEPNATGGVGVASALGLATPGTNDLSLIATGLPTERFRNQIVRSDQARENRDHGGSGSDPNPVGCDSGAGRSDYELSAMGTGSVRYGRTDVQLHTSRRGDFGVMPSVAWSNTTEESAVHQRPARASRS